jgi:PmbA protein
MAMEDLLRICDQAVEAALAGGADEAEAYAVSGKGVDVELQKNDVQIAKSTHADGLGIRVFRNRSLGFAFINSFDPDGIAESVERAIGIAKAAPSDEHNGLPEPTPIEYLEGIYDERAPSCGVREAVEKAIAMLRTARDYDPRVTVDAGGLSVSYGTRAVSNSRGVRAAEDGSATYCLIMGMAKDGDTVSSFDYQFDGTRSMSGIDPVAVAAKFAENVVRSLGAVKGESFKGPVVLSPKSVTEVISYPVQFAIRASSVQKETSKLAGKVGERIASELVSIVDDATLEDGFATQSFDREGLRPSTLPLIEAGVLRNYLYDTYTARKDGRASTGHASGGAGAVPSISTTNVVWSEGETPVDDIIAGIDRGVLVTRYSGNVDPVSGDFSGSVKGGRMIRGGKLAEPLCGTMIAGNAFDLLPSITAVSRERERLFSELLPYVRLDGVSVTSG